MKEKESAALLEKPAQKGTTVNYSCQFYSFQFTMQRLAENANRKARYSINFHQLYPRMVAGHVHSHGPITEQGLFDLAQQLFHFCRRRYHGPSVEPLQLDQYVTAKALKEGFDTALKACSLFHTPMHGFSIIGPEFDADS